MAKPKPMDQWIKGRLQRKPPPHHTQEPGYLLNADQVAQGLEHAWLTKTLTVDGHNFYLFSEVRKIVFGPSPLPPIPDKAYPLEIGKTFVCSWHLNCSDCYDIPFTDHQITFIGHHAGDRLATTKNIEALMDSYKHYDSWFDEYFAAKKRYSKKLREHEASKAG